MRRDIASTLVRGSCESDGTEDLCVENLWSTFDTISSKGGYGKEK
jgi:hypothetical protein